MRNQGTIRVLLGLFSGTTLWLMWRAWNLTPPELESVRLRYAIASALFGQNPSLDDCVTVSDWRGLLPLSLLFSVLFSALNPLPRFLLLLGAIFMGAAIGLHFFHGLRLIVPLGGPAIMLTCSYICGSLIHVEVEKIARNRSAAIEAQLGAEAERQRIARDLHDACLSSISDAIRLADNLRSQDDAPREIRSTLEGAIMDIRRVINDLHPTILDEFGLAVALEHIAEDFQKQTGVVCDFESAGEFSFSKSEELFMYRIVQEALSNVRKHAGAKQVHIALAQHGARVLMTIDDDGLGGKIESKQGSFGLRNMRERAKLLSGTIHWRASARFPSGTQVRLEVPMAQSDLQNVRSVKHRELYAASDS